MQSPTNASEPIRRPVDHDLVRRVIESPAFVRSPRLSHFLRHICQALEAGCEEALSEQSIGTAVFGRDPDYDSTIDSIVRSHATRLRHRLREYFEGEGAYEPVVLTVPKGSYIPRFELRNSHAENSSKTARVEIAEDPQAFTVNSPERTSAEDSERRREETKTRLTILRLRWVVCALAVLCLVSLAMLFLRTGSTSRHMHHPFWSAFLHPGKRPTLIVESDSGLVMMEHLTHRLIPLTEYASGEYLKNAPADFAVATLPSHLASKRYTPVVDTLVYDRLANLVRGADVPFGFRYARDLRLDDLKEGNTILMGSHESDPWVSLFEPSMNFLFESDLHEGFASIVNRNPKPGEAMHYAMKQDDPNHTVYGLLAYRPNLNGTGHVLILEGLTVAGTQSACEFLFDDSYLLPFLESIRRPDRSIPHFEVLVRSSSLAGQSSDLQAVAFRVNQ